MLLSNEGETGFPSCSIMIFLSVLESMMYYGCCIFRDQVRQVSFDPYQRPFLHDMAWLDMFCEVGVTIYDELLPSRIGLFLPDSFSSTLHFYNRCIPPSDHH